MDIRLLETPRGDASFQTMRYAPLAEPRVVAGCLQAPPGAAGARLSARQFILRR